MTISINKTQTNVLKGVGILLIVLHNFFHTVNPSSGENEFTFDLQYTKNFYHILTDSFIEVLNIMFSFFGHYRVQIFIFISGYGLAKSYLTKKR